MATVIGAAGLTWGITAETGGVAQSFTETLFSDKAEARDIDGDVSGVSYYGKRKNATLVVLSNGSTSQQPGQSISFTNSSLGGGTYYADSVSIQKSNESWNTAVFTATAYL